MIDHISEFGKIPPNLSSRRSFYVCDHFKWLGLFLDFPSDHFAIINKLVCIQGIVLQGYPCTTVLIFYWKCMYIPPNTLYIAVTDQL